MANRTITGCYSAGSIVFEGEACDSGDYTGCYVTSGEHTGMIAIVVSETNCDDTYYACFDSTTGRFSVDIPDNCCLGEPCNFTNCGSDATPQLIGITLSGFTVCVGPCLSFGSYSSLRTVIDGVNGDYILQQIDEYPCWWATDEDTTPIWKTENFYGSECGGDPYSASYFYLNPKIIRTSNTQVQLRMGPASVYYYGTVEEGHCTDALITGITTTNDNQNYTCPWSEESPWALGVVVAGGEGQCDVYDL